MLGGSEAVPAKRAQTLLHIAKNWLSTNQQIAKGTGRAFSNVHRDVVWLKRRHYIARTKQKGWYPTLRGIIRAIDFGADPERIESAVIRSGLHRSQPNDVDSTLAICEEARRLGSNWREETSREKLLLSYLWEAHLLYTQAMNRRAKWERIEKRMDANRTASMTLRAARSLYLFGAWLSSAEAMKERERFEREEREKFERMDAKQRMKALEALAAALPVNNNKNSKGRL